MLRFRTGVVCLALLLVALPGAVLGQSQATTGVIEGTVSDEAGAPLPGASVSIRNTATNFEKATTTGPDGRFHGLALPLGPYRVTVGLAGFSTLVREGLDLGVGQTINLGLALKLSQRAESVTVTGAAPVVETTRTEGSTEIDSAAIKGLPTNGRNYLEFTKLTPGVTTVQGPDGDELSVNGQKGIQNNVSVDGNDFNNPFFGEQRGGQRPPFTFNLDAVKEVVVVSDGANAEFGRASAGFVNVVTKSGTNDFHGSAHGTFKDQGLASAPVNQDGSSAPKYDFKQQQYGLTVGGPFVKDKLFFFGAFDYQKGTSTKQTDPNRIDPALVQYFASVGAPDQNGPIDRTNDAHVFLGKIDWAISEQHLATVRYNYTWSQQKNGTFDVDLGPRQRERGRGRRLERRERHAPVDPLELDAERVPHPVGARRPAPPVRRAAGPRRRPPLPGHGRQLRRLPLRGAVLPAGRRPRHAPAAQRSPHVHHGQSHDQGWLRVQRDQHDADLPRLRERPIPLRLGLGLPELREEPELRRVLGWDVEPDRRLRGRGVDHRSGSSVPAERSGRRPHGRPGGTQSIDVKEPAAFIQDKWQPLPNLTVSFGLRWEAQIEPDPITPAGQVFYSKFIGTSSMGQAFPSDGNIPSDYSMWQPRLGIVWDPNKDGKTVVRASGGIFAARVPGLNVASVRSTNGTISYTYAAGSAFNTVPAYPNILNAATLPATPDHPQVYVWDKNNKNPRTYQINAAVEREVARTSRSRSGTTTHIRSTSGAGSTATTRCSGRPGQPASARTARTASRISPPSSRRGTASTTGSRSAS